MVIITLKCKEHSKGVKEMGKIAAISTLVLLLSVAGANATLITIEIEAVVQEVQDLGDGAGYLEGNIKVDDIITGTYTYDSSILDSSPSDAIHGNYWHYGPACGISLSVGGFEFRTDPASVYFLVEIINDGSIAGGGGVYDSYGSISYNNLPLSNGTVVDEISWLLIDGSGTALSSDALPTTAPVLDNWQSSRQMYLKGESREGLYTIRARVTSTIPEPATLSLLIFGSLLLRRKSRFLN